MVEQVVRPRVGPATSARWRAAALVTVPTALAGLAMVWPGPRLADDLRARSEGALTFPADSAVLAGPAAATVGEVAELLVAEPTALVVVEGHVADTPGGVDVAQQLSERRAQVVADALVAAGVDRSRITTSGVGARQPLETPAASRRVEIRTG